MLPTIDLSTPGAGWVLAMLFKGTVLLLAIAALAAVARRASAALRHLVWSAGIVAVLVLPLLSVALPWRLAVLPAPVSSEAPSPAAPAPGGATVPDDRAGSPLVQAPAVSPTAGDAATATPSAFRRVVSAVPLASLLAAVWLGVALVLLARLALGAAVLARLVRRAAPLDTPDWTRPLMEAADRLALPRLPRLLMSERLPMPFACGIARPTIVLPAAAADWDDRRRRAVLCHELAHVRRSDLALNALGQLACALWWFHPLVWIAARRLRIESERACDDLVLGVGTRASEYADHLLHIVCGAARARTPAVALPMAQRHEFEGRMLAILERGARRNPPAPRHAAAFVALGMAFVVPLAVAERAAEAERAIEADGTVETPTAAATAARPEPRPPAADPASRSTAPAEAPAPQPSRSPEPDGSAVQDSGPGRVVTALVRALADDVPGVREDAAYALGQLGAPSAVAPLGARLLADPAPDVRRMIAWSLGQLGSRAATAALNSAVVGDSSAGVRAMAVWALGQLGDPASVTALAAAVRDDASGDVRGRAAWALGTIAARPAPPSLIAALTDAEPEIRYRAAWALGQIADPAAAPMLSTTMGDTDPKVRRAAFWALGQLPGDAAQPALLKALEDPDPEIRARAARSLGGRRGAEPWPWPWPMPINR